MHDLKKGPYSFAHDQSYPGNRFVLHFDEAPDGIPEPGNSSDNGYVYLENGNLWLYWENPSAGSRVEVYDVLGRKQYDSRVLASRQTLMLNESVKGYLLVKVIDAGKTQVFKVLR